MQRGEGEGGSRLDDPQDKILFGVRQSPQAHLKVSTYGNSTGLLF